MNEHEMKQRTKKFALRILDLADALPRVLALAADYESVVAGATPFEH